MIECIAYSYGSRWTPSIVLPERGGTEFRDEVYCGRRADEYCEGNHVEPDWVLMRNQKNLEQPGPSYIAGDFSAAKIGPWTRRFAAWVTSRMMGMPCQQIEEVELQCVNMSFGHQAIIAKDKIELPEGAKNGSRVSRRVRAVICTSGKAGTSCARTEIDAGVTVRETRNPRFPVGGGRDRTRVVLDCAPGVTEDIGIFSGSVGWGMLKEVVDFALVPGVHVTDSAMSLSEPKHMSTFICHEIANKGLHFLCRPIAVGSCSLFWVVFHIYAFDHYHFAIIKHKIILSLVNIPPLDLSFIWSTLVQQAREHVTNLLKTHTPSGMVAECSTRTSSSDILDQCPSANFFEGCSSGWGDGYMTAKINEELYLKTEQGHINDLKDSQQSSNRSLHRSAGDRDCLRGCLYYRCSYLNDVGDITGTRCDDALAVQEVEREREILRAFYQEDKSEKTNAVGE
ncbi:hypothetical protein BKA82DRAFT_4011463 [Pisolithus tinctorius]|nr:hypothetical protein BKA82DRAFT_4011463 [Pisolithus tinctorius]